MGHGATWLLIGGVAAQGTDELHHEENAQGDAILLLRVGVPRIKPERQQLGTHAWPAQSPP